MRQLLLALCITPVFALTLQEALERGLSAHALLASADARVRTAEGLRTQAGLKPNPRLFLQSENTRFHGRPTFVYSREADSFVYASQVVETGGKRSLRAASADASVSRSRADRETLRWQLAARIAAAYWTAAGAARYREAFAESIRNFDLTVQYHRDRVGEGAMAEVDLLRVQLESERLRAAFRTAEQDAVTSRIRLFREMNVPDDPAATFTEVLEQLPAVERLAMARPDLVSLQQGIEEAAANVKLQRANARPDPELMGGYKRTNGFDTLIAGVQINLPFRNRNEGNIAAAEAGVQAAAASLRAAERAAQSDIEAAYTAYETRRALVEKTLPAVREQAREIARISGAAYREGGTDLLRLLDAERARIDSDLLYVRALTEFHLSVVELQSALGILR
jgi:cobalt-zinc-cadmium efflux system outer membrane protein